MNYCSLIINQTTLFISNSNTRPHIILTVIQVNTLNHCAISVPGIVIKYMDTELQLSFYIVH